MVYKKPTYKIAVNGRFLTQRLTGVQRFAYEIVKQLLQSNLEIIVLVPKGPIFDAYEIDGWPILKVGSLGGQFWEQLSLPVFLYANNIKADGSWLLLNLCNTAPVAYHKNVVTLHDLSFIENPAWFKNNFVIFYKSVIPVLLRRAELVCTVSKFSKGEIHKHYPQIRKEVEVIYNAPSEFLCADKGEGLSFLTTQGLHSRKYILSVCSLEPRKNLITLIDSFSGLKTKDISLVLVGGKGKVFSGLRLDTANDPRIKLLGYVTDSQLQILYEQALCFVYPSVYEGFGLPPLEAMRHSCPVIVSHIPPLKEVCGNAALYFDPNSTADLLNKIEELISSHRLQEEMKAMGKERAAEFTWNKSAGKLKVLLSRLINIDTKNQP